MAGKVNLNTRQPAVIKALISGTLKNEFNSSNATSGTDTIAGTELDTIANAVIARTSGANVWEGPLANISELAGKLLGKNVGGLPSNDSSIYTYAIPGGDLTTGGDHLRNTIYTGIDLVAQTGKYPASANGLSDFIVEGEKRQWVHIAIDRATGEVLDCQIEPVTE